MKSIITILFSVTIILSNINITNAQVANYAFSETTGSYQVIIGDPALASWSGTISGSSSNRQTFNTPFAFCVGGNNSNAGSGFTTSHDGWAAFGTPSVTSTSSRYPLSNFNNVMSAFGVDLITTGTSSYGARVEGSAPNRVLVLQWGQSYFGDSNQSPFVTTNYWKRAVNGHSNDRLHFQIRLYETTNVIEFCYLISNPRTTSSGSLTTDVQVGLRGASASDFNVRRRTGTNVVWNGNNTAAGALPTAGSTTNTMHFNNVRNNATNKPTFVIPANPGTSTSTSGKAGPRTATIFRWSPVGSLLDPPATHSGCYFSPLPVELSEFSAEAGDKVNSLYWTTISEQNSDYFIVERSLNGADWDFVGRVQSAGNSSSEIQYTLEDRAFTNFINYYRLKQVDIDGKTKIYNMIKVDNRDAKKDLIKTVNLMGQEIGPFYQGMVIDIYSDGTTEKYYKQ